MALHPVVAEVTQRVVARSQSSRAAYVARMEQAAGSGPHRGVVLR